MRLTFPNGEHADVVEPSRITLGSGSDSSVRLPGLADRHAVLANDRRGLWLVIESSEATAHVNARPVSRLALVRPGDLISLGQVQVLLRSESDPQNPQLPAATAAFTRETTRNSPICSERFLLRGVGGSHYGQSFPLSDPVVIGRGESSNLRLDEPTLGDRHARVELHGDRVVLRDLAMGHGDGTLLNGIRVRNALLAAGDQLAWEQNRFVLEAPGLSAPVQRHDTTPLPKTKSQGPTTQTMRPVTAVHAAPAAMSADASMSSRKGAATVWWLIVAAAALGAAITALLLFAPKLGN
ncbi:MAG TPA: FHA domain-containing protein [Xanthomonadaceae bacterium]|jgi:pSer/pThr/pTyr-binding forkhead associated (FHA) protein